MHLKGGDTRFQESSNPLVRESSLISRGALRTKTLGVSVHSSGLCVDCIRAPPKRGKNWKVKRPNRLTAKSRAPEEHLDFEYFINP